ncbi:hypothetical protein CHH78_02130 [Shouchella clausii]|uniref:Sporulation histidine kinase inhibitor Sda n=1 Tax=Shouchella clausii TaxID=79880 RepID=A0A268RVN0_SHOCL|nr:hypothetical protein CHH76_05320 [Shouchella clausii]PAD41218.1 hypothetical protein CHH54_18430 [Bacillus sp. 7520-S]PAE86259.1 hypothetical protein CHH78_02130 [Shouchella clausii]PAE96924.1 hypothetical protein CHH71_11955 [Shouchella clausii]PAF06945.1 hypothetical protein CHH66_02120 [Shouchella clausii]
MRSENVMLSDLQDDVLYEAWNKAVEQKLDATFIAILKQEIEKRGFVPSN